MEWELVYNKGYVELHGTYMPLDPNEEVDEVGYQVFLQQVREHGVSFREEYNTLILFPKV